MITKVLALGPLAWKGLKFINDKTNGKFSKYLGNKAVELGAYGVKRLLNKSNSDKANEIAKKVAENAVEAAKEITGDDSYITKNVTKAANIISPSGQQMYALQVLPSEESVPYSKRLYGSNFQRYIQKRPIKVKRVKLMKKHKHGRILQDINES